MTTLDKYELFKRTAHMKSYLFPGRTALDHADCLVWAMCGIIVLRSHAQIPAVLQAGSAQWPMVPEDQDDGVSATHFTYEWSPGDLLSKASVAMGNLPEMHVWIGVVKTQEIIDFTTHALPAQATRCGLNWRMPPPPQFLWCKVDQMPKRTLYLPNMEATVYAAKIANKLTQENVMPYLEKV